MINHKIERIGFEKGCRFGAWCVMAVAQDDIVLEYLDSKICPNFSNEIIEFIEKIWECDISNDFIVAFFEKTRSIEWDLDSVPSEDEAKSQGAIDILGACESLAEAVINKSPVKLVECSNAIINKLDYCVQFAKDEDISMFEFLLSKENDMQAAFIDELYAGALHETDILRYHAGFKEAFRKMHLFP